MPVGLELFVENNEQGIMVTQVNLDGFFLQDVGCKLSLEDTASVCASPNPQFAVCITLIDSSWYPAYNENIVGSYHICNQACPRAITFQVAVFNVLNVFWHA